jgi:ABC-type antimicrobial peptide transport system ATPase subunit
MSNPLVAVGSLPRNSLFINDNYIYVIVGESDSYDPLVKVIGELNNGHWMRVEDKHKIHKLDFFKLVSLIVPS